MKFVLDFLGGFLSALSPRRRPYSGFARSPQPVSDDAHPWHKEHARRRELGAVDGRYYLYYVDVIKEQKRRGEFAKAESLLIKILDAIEREEAEFKDGVAPWYYEQLAIIYRKQKRFDDEVAVLERYAAKRKAAGRGPQRLAERLTKIQAKVREGK